MEEFVLDGNKYYYKNGKWFTSNWHAAPTGIVGKLNKQMLNQTELTDKSMEELLQIIDGARAVENYHLSAQALEAAIRIASVGELRLLLPRLTSNYRKCGRSQTAIDLANSYVNEYKKQVWSPALFTSLAAAYCDIGDFATAREKANLARALSRGESSPELISVYKRIKESE